MPPRHGMSAYIMRMIAFLTCGLLLAACARLTAPLPITNALDGSNLSLRPASGTWLCGAPPSARTKNDLLQRGDEPLAGYKALYKFKAGADGAQPYGGMIALNGKLYGTTYDGGSGGYGTVFALTASGKESPLYNFTAGNDGAYPCSGLAVANGKLYGTTQSGGTHGWGTLFEV